MHNTEETTTSKSKQNTSNDESAIWDDFGFPWPMVYLPVEVTETIKSIPIPKFIKYLFASFYVQLLVIFILCIISITGGYIYLRYLSDDSMRGIYFIVQGSCGLFVVTVHTCIILFDGRSSEMTQFSVEDRSIFWYLIAFTHLLTMFCIVWFFIGIIWFSYTSYYASAGLMMYLFNILMIIIQYIVATWLIYLHIYNNPRFLQWLLQENEGYLNRFSYNVNSVDYVV